MAYTPKTQPASTDVYDFIQNTVENSLKQQDSLHLIQLMREWTGFEPVLWGASMIGFGQYHYKYASGHEGDTFIIGFAPRKAAFSLYVLVEGADYGQLLERLGKYTMGKACIYIKKLADIDTTVLEQICKKSLAYVAKQYASNAK